MPISGGTTSGSTKPAGGWLKTDLEQAVQDSLVKADTAVPEADRGAINGIASLDAAAKVPLSQLPIVVLSEAAYNAIAVESRDPGTIYMQTPT